MIKRLHKARRSHGTLVANGRRKRRNGKTSQSAKLKALRKSIKSVRAKCAFDVARAKGLKPSRKKRGLSLVANGHRRKHHRKMRNGGGRGLSYVRRRKLKGGMRNPSMGGFDVMELGIGAVVAIAAGAVGEGLVNKYGSSIPSGPIKDAAPSLLVAAAAYFGGKKFLKSAKAKKIANYVAVLSVFKAIDDSMGKKIEDVVRKALPNLSGAYMPATYGYTGGAYMDQQGQTYGALPSAPSLYGI